MIYSQAILPRTGLGNRLFPWARCRIFSYVNNIEILAPRWFQLKLGPLLRGESDPRFYYNLFKREPGEITGIKKFLIQSFAKKMKEPEDFSLFRQDIQRGESTLILFSGFKDYFQKLNGWNEFIYNKLRTITKERWLKKVDDIKDVPPIGIHVRRGDFRKAESKEDFIYKGLLKTPMAWFVQSLEVIRSVAKHLVKAFVVSDGTARELKELLACRNVEYICTRSAISDLLVLSKAKVLISSGGSTFSAWASFFGQMPTISYPGQPLAWFKLKNRKGHYIGEFNPTSPPEKFIGEIKTFTEEGLLV